jgi:RNA polymerase sigma factor for flagellar operon FliA
MAVGDSLSHAPYGAPELAALAAAQAGERGKSSEDLEAARQASEQMAEARLWQRHIELKDAQAREDLILLHLPYAKAVAGGLYRQHTHHETEFKEYVQWATLGLIEALDRYDPQRGAQFRTYAHARMLGAMRNGLAHVSERQEQITLHRKLAAERLAALEGVRDMASQAVSGAELMRGMAEISAGMMLTFMLDDTGMMASESSALPDGCYESLAFKDEQQRVRGLIGQLTPREQSVIRLHYLQGLAFTDVAQALGITKGRVSQLHEQALTRMRKLLQP